MGIVARRDALRRDMDELLSRLGEGVWPRDRRCTSGPGRGASREPVRCDEIWEERWLRS